MGVIQKKGTNAPLPKCGPGPHLSIRPRLEIETPAKISLLTNSLHFCIAHVFIMETSEVYRLMAIHQGEIKSDETYKTPKGAKIAFLKFFGKNAIFEGVKPQWTPFFHPEPDWGPLQIALKERQK